jgi:hypothetical protein
VLAAQPAAARAEDDTWLWATMAKVPGNPLEVGVGENASLHANLDGSGPSDIFWFDEAGLTLAVFENGGVRTFGTESVEGDELKLVSLPVASGSGTGADPWTITSTWDAGAPARLRVSQTVAWTEGSPRFAVSYSVQNVSGAPLNFRAYISAQISSSFSVPIARSDGSVPGSVGVAVPLDGGVRDPNDPVFDGYSFGRATDLEPSPSTPWRGAVAGEGVDARLAMSQGQPLPASLTARARNQPIVAADWDAYAPGHAALPAGGTYTFGARMRHASALRTVPLVTGTPNNQPFTLQVRTDLADGGVLGQRRLGWIIDGYSRELSGTMTTDDLGRATLTWTADGQQYDRVIVWIDSDGDGVWDRDTETTRQSGITWDGPLGGDADTPGTGIDGSDVSASGGSVTGVAVGAGAEPLPAGTNPVAPVALRISGLAVKRVAPRTYRVSGRTSATPAGRMTVALRTRAGRLLARKAVAVKAGRFTTRMKLKRSPRSRRLTIALRYAGDKTIAPLALKRRATLK